MTTPVVNHAYLKSLASQAKTEEANRILALFLPALQHAARAGLTSYVFDMSNMNQVPAGQTVSLIQQRLVYSTPLPELVTLLQAQLNDCVVTLQETTGANAKKSLLIDWS
jgi:hypothetical protein